MIKGLPGDSNHEPEKGKHTRQPLLFDSEQISPGVNNPLGLSKPAKIRCNNSSVIAVLAVRTQPSASIASVQTLVPQTSTEACERCSPASPHQSRGRGEHHSTSEQRTQAIANILIVYWRMGLQGWASLPNTLPFAQFAKSQEQKKNPTSIVLKIQVLTMTPGPVIEDPRDNMHTSTSS